MTYDARQSDYLVPDLLRPGLKVIFVGTAPSRISAAAKAYYANPQNKFWRTLHAVGLTPRLLAPSEYPRLLDYGIGLTDVAKRHSGMDSALPAEAWRPQEVQAKVEKYAPKVVAFTSKRAAAESLGTSTGKLPYGPQAFSLGASQVWVLPSTSPLAHNHFSMEAWQQLADYVSTL